MLPQENFDMRVLLRPSETAITRPTQLNGNWSVTQTGHRMVVSPTPFPLESSPLPLVSYPDPPPKRKGWSGKYSTVLYDGLAVAMDSAKS